MPSCVSGTLGNKRYDGYRHGTSRNHSRLSADFLKELYDVTYHRASPALGETNTGTGKKTEVKLMTMGIGPWRLECHQTPLPQSGCTGDSNEPRLLPGTPDIIMNWPKSWLPCKKGVLIIGSAETWYNLRMVAWDKLNTDNYGFDWALKPGEMNHFILTARSCIPVDYSARWQALPVIVPTPEHSPAITFTHWRSRKKRRCVTLLTISSGRLQQ